LFGHSAGAQFVHRMVLFQGGSRIALAVTGRPELPVAEARLLIAALVLVGPVGALAALVARTWYPRLGGVVAASSLAALAMLARTVLS